MGKLWIGLNAFIIIGLLFLGIMGNWNVIALVGWGTAFCLQMQLYNEHKSEV